MIWHTLENIFAFLGAFAYVLFFSRCMRKKETLSTKKAWIAAITYAFLIMFANIMNGSTRYFTLILSVFYCMYVFRATFRIVLIWCLTAIVVNGIADFIVTNTSILFPGITYELTDLPGIPRLVCVAFVKMLQLSCYFLMTIRIEKVIGIKLTNSLLLGSVPLGSWIILEVLFLYIDALPSSFNYSGIPIVGGVGMMGILISAIALFNHLVVQEREYASIEIQLRTTQLTKKHLHEMDILYANLSELRHNFTNHLSVIHGLQENGDYTALGEYVRGLGDVDYRSPAFTGNYVLDAIIGSKFEAIENEKISFSVEMAIPSSLPISDVELSILFGNLLDNSLEAISRLNSDGLMKFIKIKSRSTEKYWVLICQNTAGQEIIHTTEKIRSTKKQDGLHGIGTHQISNVAASTGGYVYFSQENNMFTATVMLKIA